MVQVDGKRKINVDVEGRVEEDAENMRAHRRSQVDRR